MVRPLLFSRVMRWATLASNPIPMSITNGCSFTNPVSNETGVARDKSTRAADGVREMPKCRATPLPEPFGMIPIGVSVLMSALATSFTVQSPPTATGISPSSAELRAISVAWFFPFVKVRVDDLDLLSIN